MGKIEAHGTEFGSRMKKMREQMEAMKEIWTKTTAEYTGEIVRVPSMRTWPKPAINKTVRNYQHTQPLDPPRSAVRSLAAT